MLTVYHVSHILKKVAHRSLGDGRLLIEGSFKMLELMPNRLQMILIAGDVGMVLCRLPTALGDGIPLSRKAAVQAHESLKDILHVSCGKLSNNNKKQQREDRTTISIARC